MIEAHTINHREISITGSVYSISVSSSYKEENIEYLTNIALGVLENLKKEK